VDDWGGKDASEYKRPRYFDEEPTINGPYLPCKKCGKDHKLGILDVATNVHTPIDICYKCLWEGWAPKFTTEQIVLHEPDLNGRRWDRI